MEQNSTTSSQPPPPAFSDRGPHVIIMSCILHAISIPVLFIRIWSRSRPAFRLGPDDWAIMGAAVFDLAQWTLVLVAIANGLGRPSFYVSPSHISTVLACYHFASHCSPWAICFAKFSIAYSFRRLRPDSMAWRVLLLTMMVLPVAVAITTSGFLFATCRPLSAVWDMTKKPTATCLYFDMNRKRVLVTSSLTVATDWILALLPITFIRRIRRSVRERIVLMVIMGLGLLASVASIFKVYAISLKTLTGDPLRDGLDVVFWGIMEVQLGIIATCIPFIRRIVTGWLVKIGLITNRKGPTLYHMENQNSSGPGIRITPGVELELESHTNVNLSEAHVNKAFDDDAGKRAALNT